MGIPGLLQFTRPAETAVHVSRYKGRRVGVDTYSWLHKGVFAAATELALGRPTNRHIKYCVRLMDPQELDQVQAYLADRQSHQVASNRLLHAAERWRDRLVEEGDPGLDALLDEHPDLERHALRQLQRDAARERATGRPAGAGRKLFRALRDALTRASEQKIQ